MKNKYILTIAAFSIIAGSIFSQQTLQARSETATEMEKGTEHGEKVAGPVGAVFGGLFGGTVGLAKDTENAVTGETEEYRILRDRRYEDETMPASYYEEETMPMTYDTYMDEDMYETYTNGRSETAKEMEKASESGEEIAGPLGALAGGIVGAGVGLVKDTGEAVTERADEEEVILEPRETERFLTDEDMDITIIPRDVSNMDNPLTIDEVE